MATLPQPHRADAKCNSLIFYIVPRCARLASGGLAVACPEAFRGVRDLLYTATTLATMEVPR